MQNQQFSCEWYFATYTMYNNGFTYFDIKWFSSMYVKCFANEQTHGSTLQLKTMLYTFLEWILALK